MKIRSGFVTNSSSSSYIVAINNNLLNNNLAQELEETYKSIVSNYVNNVRKFFVEGEESDKIIENDEQLKKFVYNDFSTSNDDKIYEEYSKFIKEGYSIYQVRLEWGESDERVLKYLCDGKNVILLDESD